MAHDYWNYDFCDDNDTPSTATRKARKPKKSTKTPKSASTTTRRAGSKRKGGEQGEGNRFNVYVDEAGRWRWRLWGENNKILADGGQGYASNVATRNAIKKNILSLRNDTPIKTTPAPAVVPVLPPSTSTGTQSASTLTTPAVKLALVAHDHPTVAPNTLQPLMQVQVQDGLNSVVTNYVGTVNVVLGNNPSGASLYGTLTESVVSGVATFDDLKISKAGVDYTLVFSASGLSSVTHAPFTVA
jgi:uncharacterized protein YegP (UPF0339 family)